MNLFTLCLASLEGFEPPTDRVEAGCSESTELQREGAMTVRQKPAHTKFGNNYE